MSNTVDIDHLNVDLSKCDYIDIDFRQCRISSFATGWQNGDPVGCDFRIYANYDDFKNHNNILNDNFYYKSDATFKDTYYTYDVDISVYKEERTFQYVPLLFMLRGFSHILFQSTQKRLLFSVYCDKLIV